MSKHATYRVWAEIERERNGDYERVDEPVVIDYPTTLRGARKVLRRLSLDGFDSQGNPT
jgi:hypothetical protein